MKLNTYTVEVLEIQEPGDHLDPIRVIFRPVMHEKYSQGEVIVTCYDRAWKTWFGNMGSVHDTSLQDFVRTCEPGYLANRLAESAGSSPGGKRRSRDEKYLLRIVHAIRSALVMQHSAELDAARERVQASGAPQLADLLAAIPGPAHKRGLTAVVRDLQVGERVEIPRAWEKAVTSTAKRLGITLTMRRLGASETTTLWRGQDPAPVPTPDPAPADCPAP